LKILLDIKILWLILVFVSERGIVSSWSLPRVLVELFPERPFLDRRELFFVTDRGGGEMCIFFEFHLYHNSP